MENILEIFLLTLGASFVQRTTGFGFGIFIMTMLPFLMPSYGEATTLSGLLALTTSAMISFRMRRYITWKRLLPILLTFIITSSAALRADFQTLGSQFKILYVDIDLVLIISPGLSCQSYPDAFRNVFMRYFRIRYVELNA